MSGTCRSGGRAGCSRSTRPPTTTSLVAPDRPRLEQRIKEICQTRVRYGYRRVHVLLRREGWRDQPEEDAAYLPRVGPATAQQDAEAAGEGQAAGGSRPATRSNETWAMDFVHDQLATGRKLRVLTIVDTFSRFSPALEPRFTFRGADVVEMLERVCRRSGIPGDDPGRSGHRVRLPRSRSVGLSARRHARLLPARQADRQCLHRSVQRPLPGGVSERPLVPDPCRRPEKIGGLAQILQPCIKTPISLCD